MKRLAILFLVFCTAAGSTFAQSDAGKDAFAVLNLFNSAQTTARGLDFVPRISNDVATALTNPSTVDSTLHNMASITYTDIFAGSFQGALSYGRQIDKLGSFAFGLQYINYGSFIMTESNGDEVGSFSAADYMLNIAWGRQIEKNLYFGATFKPLFSHYESYSSFSVAFDVAATWANSSRNFQASIILQNIGRQIHSFSSERDTLPFNIQLGISKKFEHAPVILYVVADYLNKWNIREDDALNPRDVTSIDGSVTEENKLSAFTDKCFRHLRFAIDFTPSRYFYLSAGYSWRQHQEMAVDDAFSLAGLSYGFGINIKNYTVNYARNEYHNYGAPNYITLTHKF